MNGLIMTNKECIQQMGVWELADFLWNVSDNETKRGVSMRVKPILFNTEMVKAILDGRKTVTRRVIRPHYKGNDYGWRIVRNTFSNEIICAEYYDEWEEFTRIMEPPYQPGDVLYVRETFAPVYPDGESNEVCGYMYKADSLKDYDARFPDGKDFQWEGKWRSSIHMPKEVARIWLKVTDVRVERLQEIDYFGCINEGIPYKQYEKDIIKDFSALWDSTIKKPDLDRYGWETNPWVWRIAFERCEKPESEE